MYVRKVKKGGKTYLYYYKSQRKGNKVKSIYVGKALEKPSDKILKKERAHQKINKNNDMVNSLLEFDTLLFDINKMLMLKDIKGSIEMYNRMLEIYSNLEIQKEDKEKLFNKLSSLYEDLVNLGRENKIELLE